MTRSRSKPASRGTKAGTHVPVLLRQVLQHLSPAEGETIVDCTLGFGGHAAKFMTLAGSEGLLLGLDVDADQLKLTARYLGSRAARLISHNRNFSQLPAVLAEEKIGKVDIIFADLGVSSMQIDDPGRGIGYASDGLLDMRLDQSLEMSAADVLATISEKDLSRALADYSDEPDHKRIANWIVNQRQALPMTRTKQLVRLILAAKGVTENNWKKSPVSRFGKAHPAAQTFQAIRIIVNDEFANLKKLLAAAPTCLAPGGRVGIITFHQGEDKIVDAALRASLAAGDYEAISPKPITPTAQERSRNTRSASAKFRWARKAKTGL